MTTALSREQVRRAAREALGHERLLPGQADAVRAVVGGRDTLALLPTGGGKSAIYQLAGLEIDGPTVVVSPLLALQHDQLESLRELSLSAAELNSTVSAVQREDALAAFEAGSLEFLLLAPEQLAGPDTLDRLAGGRPSLFVIDEAHCVSEWGHDFRPEYRRLGAVADALGRPPILALTATASPVVREEIIERLGLRDPAVVARGFDRPNIFLAVEMAGAPETKRRALVEATVTAAADGSGIVYTATRRGAEQVAAELADAGVAAAAYHAGLGSRRRTTTQDAFMTGELRVVVATIAFGMGVDKPDVRFVHHLDVSESLDAYHQEIGRAGRDGAPAVARLFYRPQDLGLRRFQSAPATFSEADVAAVLRALRRATGSGADGPTVAGLARAAGRSVRRTDAIVGRLEDLGSLAVAPAGGVRAVVSGESARLDRDDLPALAVQGQERRRRVERSRVEMIRAYAEADGCRRRVLLNYFGETLDEPCGSCDRCLAGAGQRVDEEGQATAASPFGLNERVVHATFGPGVVAGLEPGRLTVLFDKSGYRTLDLDSVVEDGLLSAG